MINGIKEEIGGGGCPRGDVAAATAGERELCAMVSEGRKRGKVLNLKVYVSHDEWCEPCDLVSELYRNTILTATEKIRTLQINQDDILSMHPRGVPLSLKRTNTLRITWRCVLRHSPHEVLQVFEPTGGGCPHLEVSPGPVSEPLRHCRTH